MKINRTALKNFKCFKTLDLNLAPITLLTGANSSGKSSFIYSVLAILQTEQFPYYLSPNGNYVNMGSFDEIVFNHKTDKKIEISGNIEGKIISNHFKTTVDFKTTWKRNPKNELPLLDGLKFQFKSNRHLIPKFNIDFFNKDKYYLNFKIIEENGKLPALKKILLKADSLKKAKGKKITNSLIEFQGLEFTNINEFFDMAFIEIPKVPSGFVNIFEKSYDFFQKFNKAINYIGSFRQSPERTYYQKAKAKSKIDVSGEGYIDQVLEWEEKKSGKFEKLNAIMKELQLFSEIKSQKINGGRFEFKVKTHEQGILASLTDVGFGISQFLPIIVADLQLPDNSVLALSQPEMHLHPKIQAALGSYLARQINENEKQYIVETHSEYLLNRIRLAIVKEEIAPNDVALYYFENSTNGTQSHKIDLTKDGQVKNAPESFFDTYMIDTMDIAMNALEG